MGKNPRLHLALKCAAVAFLVLFVSTLLVLASGFLLSCTGIIHVPLPNRPFLAFLMTNLLVSSVISLIVSHILIRPLLHLMEVSDKIAEGDYSVRVNPTGAAPFPHLCERFNHMASSLERAADLQNSFVNNFSHEFKTPIVSILGFAKALKWDELSQSERNEYLDIIIEESTRLSDLADNVLNMSRAENQATPGKQIRFDLSEELRQSIAIIDSRWSEKEIDFVLDGKQVFATGNPQLLRQVYQSAGQRREIFPRGKYGGGHRPADGQHCPGHRGRPRPRHDPGGPKAGL